MSENSQNVDVYEMILKSAGGGYSFDPAKITKSSASASPSSKVVAQEWHEEHQEGQLAVDVVDKGKEILIISTMAGADTEGIEVYIHNDLLTIRGQRLMPVEDVYEEDFMHQECFWGKFSRTIVLPVDVKGESAKAEYKNGILTILVPKKKSDSKIKVKIVED